MTINVDSLLNELILLKQELRAAKDRAVKDYDDFSARLDRLLPPSSATRYQALIGINWSEYIKKGIQAQQQTRPPQARKHRKEPPRCSG